MPRKKLKSGGRNTIPSGPIAVWGNLTPEMFIEKQVKTAGFSTLKHS